MGLIWISCSLQSYRINLVLGITRSLHITDAIPYTDLLWISDCQTETLELLLCTVIPYWHPGAPGCQLEWEFGSRQEASSGYLVEIHKFNARAFHFEVCQIWSCCKLPQIKTSCRSKWVSYPSLICVPTYDFWLHKLPVNVKQKFLRPMNQHERVERCKLMGLVAECVMFRRPVPTGLLTFLTLAIVHCKIEPRRTWSPIAEKTGSRCIV